MMSDTSGQQMGLFFSLAVRALAAATRPKGFTQRATNGDVNVEPAFELGVESACPHLRADLAP